MMHNSLENTSVPGPNLNVLYFNHPSSFPVQHCMEIIRDFTLSKKSLDRLKVKSSIVSKLHKIKKHKSKYIP